ncbi:MAG: hypothetical protein PHO02_05540 [Candidatus Nanoarchaeia archaeon]|nr:hypothetical protein [Candidatus Nanoarchaeia archaeon]
MKTYHGTHWAEFIAFIGDTVKDELVKEIPIILEYGITSMQTGYGKFGSLEANYTAREGKGLLGKLMGNKIFTIHDNSAEWITPRVILHDSGYYGKKAEEIFKTLGYNLGMDFQVEYA